jgi:hypothetical protein
MLHATFNRANHVHASYLSVLPSAIQRESMGSLTDSYHSSQVWFVSESEMLQDTHSLTAPVNLSLKARGQKKHGLLAKSLAQRND